MFWHVLFSNLSTHFVCFHELQGFHEETDLMTMTITGMCTGEVIKRMTWWGNVNLLIRTSSQNLSYFQWHQLPQKSVSWISQTKKVFLEPKTFGRVLVYWWLIASTILLLFWRELAARWVRHLSQECATQGDGWNLGLKAYDMKCQDGVCA